MEKRNAMYIINKDYKIVYTNKFFKELYPNVKKGDICYKAITDYTQPCSACPLFDEHKESTLYNLINGEWVSSQAIEVDYKDEDCNAIIFKIWQEKRNREKNSSNKTIELIDNLNDSNPNQGVMGFKFEEGFPVFYSNQYMINLMGYQNLDELKEACGGNFINFIHPAYIEDINKVFEDSTYDGMLYHFAYKLRISSGRFVDVLVKGQITRDENNDLILLTVVNDLSKVAYSQAYIRVENESLNEQNRLLRYVNEALPGGYHRCKVDDYATLIDMSDKFVELIGYTREEIMNEFNNKFLNIVYPDDIYIVKNAIHDIKSKSLVKELTYRIKHKTKGYIWVKDTNQKCEYEGNEFVQSTILDITEEMNRQFELENQNKQLSLVRDNLPCGFKTLYDDDKFSFKYVSKECANLFGYTVEEFYEATNGNSYGYCVAADLPMINEQLAECFKENKDKYHIKFRAKCKDGSLKKVIDCGKKGIDKEGNVIYYSYCIDITEGEDNKDIISLQNRLLEQEREKIVEKENSIRQMELIYTLSKDFNTVYYMNIYTEEMKYLYSRETKYSKEQIEEFYKEHDYTYSINQFIDKYVHKDDQEKVRNELSIDNIREKIIDNAFIIVKYRRIIEGKPVYFETKVARVGGGLSNYVIIGYKNVDEETKIELYKQDELSEALSKAQAANKAKTIFLNNMSHDIRTPMNAIIGYSKLAIKNLDMKDKVLHYLEKIDKSSVHLLSLINDVLDMSRIESGKMKIENKPEKLSTIIHEIMNIVESDIKTKLLHFLSEALNVVHDDIICDKLRITQILLNLLSNAMKFTSYGGKIYLKIMEIPNDTPNFATFKIVIKDTGIGMSKEFVEHIFEPFVRAETTTVSGIVGTGLGMSIVKKIVDMLHGKIKVQSKEGYGSEFTITLNFEIQQDVDNSKLKVYENSRALIIDDRTETCESCKNILNHLNIRSDYSTLIEDIKELGLKACEENDPYKIFLINFSISHIDSLEIIKIIKELPCTKDPVIILNGYDWIDLDSEIVEKEHINFISKPMFISDIKKILIKTLGEEEDKIKKNKELAKVLFYNKKILLVEDNEFNQEIACEILKAQGFVVETANNGMIALKMLQNNPNNYYDIVLMDIQMPVMDGYEATRSIRKFDDEVLKNIPIIAMTANAFSEDKVKCLEAGMNDFLTKPIEVDRLFTILGKILADKTL